MEGIVFYFVKKLKHINLERSSEQHQQQADNENEESSSERVPIKKRAKRTRNVNQLN